MRVRVGEGTVMTETGQREQERERLIFFSFIITSSGFKKIFTLQKNIKGGRKPSLGEHSSPDED